MATAYHEVTKITKVCHRVSESTEKNSVRVQVHICRGTCENSRRVEQMRSRTMKRTMLSFAVVAALGLGYVRPADAQGRGGPPTLTPSKLRAIPAETTAAKAKDPNWKAPRTPWGHPDLAGI